MSKIIILITCIFGIILLFSCGKSENIKESIALTVQPISNNTPKPVDLKQLITDFMLNIDSESLRDLYMADYGRNFDFVFNDDPIATYMTVPVPGTNDYLIEFDGTIYRTDWANGILKKFLKDDVNGYKKDEILSHQLEEVGTPVWASLPRLNPSGTYLLFFSERSMVNGDKNGEMWVKNIATGEEKPLLSGSGRVLGWLNETTAIFEGTFIYSVDVETGTVQTLLQVRDMDAGLIKDQLAYQVDPGSLTFQSVETGEKTTITSKLLNVSGTYQTQGSWLAINNQVRDGDSEHSIVLYNVDSKK